MFDRQGETTPPCGEPSVAWRRSPSSSTPAFSHLSIILRMTPSVTRLSRNARRWECSAPKRVEAPPEPGSLFNRRSQLPARSHVDASGTSQVARRPVLYLCPVLRPRPNQRFLADNGTVGAAPAST